MAEAAVVSEFIPVVVARGLGGDLCLDARLALRAIGHNYALARRRGAPM